MQLTFIGTGEAFDTNRATTSYLVGNESPTGYKSTLVDCGYTTVPSLRRRVLNSSGRDLIDIPDNLVFTHFHGDHFAGLSALLIPLWDEVRERGAERDLTIASPDEILKQRVEKRMGEDYPGLYERFEADGLNIHFRKMSPDRDCLGNLIVTSALARHSVPNYAYRFSNGTKSFAISGDGSLTEESKALYQGVDLLVHEGFFVDVSSQNHASIEEVVDFAISERIPQVAIVHVNQSEREKKSKIRGLVEKASEKGVSVFFPNDGENVSF